MVFYGIIECEPFDVVVIVYHGGDNWIVAGRQAGKKSIDDDYLMTRVPIYIERKKERKDPNTNVYNVIKKKLDKQTLRWTRNKAKQIQKLKNV